MEPVYIGLTGMILIVAAWIVSIPQTPPLRLSLTYFLGSLLLTIYSILQGDPIFTTLNTLATIFSLYNAYRAFKLSRQG